MQGWDRARLGELVHGLLLRRLLRDRKGGERALALVDLEVELLPGERAGVSTSKHAEVSRATGAAGAAGAAGEDEDLVRVDRASSI